MGVEIKNERPAYRPPSVGCDNGHCHWRLNRDDLSSGV
ncbi:hypothetical protein HDE77_004178 [Rhodanobacter sp. MP7CTX1]|nr:hypothetical protein [Rhodanobacter sp. MP7CTX1]